MENIREGPWSRKRALQAKMERLRDAKQKRKSSSSVTDEDYSSRQSASHNQTTTTSQLDISFPLHINTQIESEDSCTSDNESALPMTMLEMFIRIS